jgi:hypothetical protein
LLSTGILVSSTNKTDRHDIAEILLKVAVNTITPLNLFDLRRVSDIDRAVFQYVGMFGTPVFLNLKYLERSTAYAISSRSVLLVEETRIPGENHRPAASH